MSKVSPAITNFNSGEFSPMIAGRVDFDRYANGCTVMENFIPTVQGPALRRGGTRYVASVKNHANRVYLQAFEFSETTAYVLEFGDQYIRFYTQNGQLLSGGTPVEVATPYTQASLFNADGTCKLRFAQSGDFLYITHPDYQPRILKRTSPTTFVLDLFEPYGGPFIGVDPDATTTVYASAQTGAITLTASTGIFQAGHVGTDFLLESKNVSSVVAWEPGKSVTAGDLRRSDNKVYRAANTGTTGSVKPVHSRGTQSDGGVNWEFQHAGYGWARITGFTSSTVVSATVVSLIPSDAVGAGNATTRWSFSSWSGVEGWPSSVAFFRERLCFARGQNVWLSVAAGFDDFSARNTSGEVTADMAISLEVASGELNSIQWLHPDRQLVAGTAGGEFIIGELTNGDPLGPGNIKVELVSRYGSRGIQPVGAGDRALFVMRAGRKVREIAYDFANDGYQTKDVTLLSDHITAGGVTDMDHAIEPYAVVWCVRSDGQLLGFTWNNEEQVRGWHRHRLGGSGIVESVAVIPRPDGTGDQVWLAVRRTINGNTRRYVEYMEDPWVSGLQEDQFYVDSGLTYSGPPATTISGLEHLEGATVAVLADGAPHPNRVVSGGAITLQAPASKVQVGLPFTPVLQTMRIEAGAADGTAQGKTKRMHKVSFRFINTGSCQVGPDANTLETLEFRTPSDPMDSPPPLYTGDKLVAWPGGYDTDGRIYVTTNQPTALGVVAVFPQVVTQDAR